MPHSGAAGTDSGLIGSGLKANAGNPFDHMGST
jgi:hypothetical protein